MHSGKRGNESGHFFAVTPPSLAPPKCGEMIEGIAPGCFQGRGEDAQPLPTT
ncbi:hypothetical protein HMPREF1556_00038 [Porphyromonas sp. oral taxon 278 str. W7784]|nr:hypothetical protein HMPREF1556_00038 [Porphyromonas sp. oral taxon 278 str. W7784]